MTPLHRSESLSELPANRWGTILCLEGGRRFNSRLAALGFTAGAQVKMLQNYGQGPLIVLVRGTRIALGRGEACKVVVEVSEFGG